MTNPTTPSARILVVEDEYLIRMLLEDMLADLGHTVAAAVGTIAEATELAARRRLQLRRARRQSRRPGDFPRSPTS